MVSKMTGNRGKYEFLEDMDTFLYHESQLSNEREEEAEAGFCNSLQIQSNNDVQLKNTCKSFVKLFKISKRQCKSGCTYGSKYSEFMNYWLNYNLRLLEKYENIETRFYEELKTKYIDIEPHNILNGKIKPIEYPTYKNMNILYKLYKVIDEIKEKTIDYDVGINKFKSNYNDALKQCFDESDDNFYNALEQFREYYEKNKPQIKSCTNGECPTLPHLTKEFKETDFKSPMIGYKLVQSVNNNLYKELKKINKEELPNLNVLVSLQYSLIFEPDINKNKCLLMNILHEYFQYCEENKNNKHLLEFITEFINEYYNNMEKIYTKIFRECDPHNNSKDYCDIYNKCNKQFNEDFSLIKSNTVMYVTHKKDYFNKLTTDDSWIGRAKAIFKDFKALSKNSPTVMSTMVALILCLFFMYKLTPLSTIFRKEKKKRKIPLFYPQRIIQDVKVDNSGYNNPPKKREKIRFAYQPS